MWSRLGRFAKGWLEPGQGFADEVSICHEANLLLRREILYPTDDWPESIVKSVGVQVENAFGSRLERFRPAR
jgi:hypothetical protein